MQRQVAEVGGEVFNGSRVWVVIPALDEAPSVGLVVAELWALTDAAGDALVDHIVVCDNNSRDATAVVAREAGATVVSEEQRGYGAACLRALGRVRSGGAKGNDVVLFVDADRSVDVSEVPALLAPLGQGADLVIGNRVAGAREPGALTPQQQFGNWLSSALIRLLWRCDVNDLGPFRAIRVGALDRLAMQDRAFGWTCEMQLRAIQHGMSMVEVPVSSLKRIGRSKISGTLLGSLRAGRGILGMVAAIWWEQRRMMRRREHHL
ncbi:MAG: glycosyltransferase family 2 protein [Pseudomonadota bacterium]